LRQTIIISSVVFISICFSCCYHSDPCSEWQEFNHFNQKTLAIVPLIDSNKHWINDNTSKSLRFINSHGYEALFTSTGKKYGYQEYDYIYREEKFDCGTLYGYDIIKTQYESIEYSSDRIPLYFSITRKKKIPQTLDSNNIHHLYEHLIIRVNNYQFEIQPDTNLSLQKLDFYDSISINSTLFHDVYHNYSDTIISTNQMNKVIGVFYSFEFGLLEFDLKNGDKWYIKK